MEPQVTRFQRLGELMAERGPELVFSLLVLIIGLLLVRWITKGLRAALYKVTNRVTLVAVITNIVSVLLLAIVVITASIEAGLKPGPVISFLTIVCLAAVGIIILFRPLIPTLPFKVWGGNLVVRPSFPVAGVPTLNDDLEWEKERGFGDIVLVSNWGKKTESGVLWSVGATSVFPTAKEGLGKNQFQLGPAAILGLLKPWGVLGVFWQHWWGLNPAKGEDAVNIQ